jgi:hypothetical protein
LKRCYGLFPRLAEELLANPSLRAAYLGEP